MARCDDALVNHDRGIFPFGAGIDHVGLDRLIRGDLAALDDAGFNQQPRRVADCRDDLLLVEEILDQLERLVVDAQQIGIDLPARQDDGVMRRRCRNSGHKESPGSLPGFLSLLV